MLGEGNVINVQDPIPAIRKSLIRLLLRDEVQLYRLETVDQLRRYFTLRYQVWKELNYLSGNKDCRDLGLESDYTDESAIPIGAFDKAGALIGCARLVFALSSEISDCPAYAGMLRGLVGEYESPCLRRNVTRATYLLLHPFDLLDAFDRFKRYYQRLVRLRIAKAEVSRVTVSPEHRRHGLGEVLVDSLLSLARRQHVNVLFLACHEQHRNFCERCGFYALPGLWCDRFSSLNEPSIAMACNLRKCVRQTLH